MGENQDRREMITHLSFFQCIPPQVADAGINGETVDLKGYRSCTFAIEHGAISSITSASYWVWRMQHASASDAGVDGTWSDCDASQVIMSVSTALTSGIVFSVWSDTGFESAVFTVAYIGPRRYTRIVLEEKANLSTAAVGVTAIRGHADAWPTVTIG